MKAQFYTVAETASLLKISKMTVYRNIKAGRLVAYKVGKEFRIKAEDLDAFLELLKTK